MSEEKSFVENLEALINKHSMENGSNTPDYILAKFLGECLHAFNGATKERSRWYGHEPRESTVLSCGAEPSFPAPQDEAIRRPLVDRAKAEEFEALARPLIKWLCENCHPHVSVIVTPTNAELLEGACSTGQILDYIRD